MKETLSAWMDGELSGQQAAPLLPQMKRDTQLRRDWDCYHLIGDALRGVEGADLGASIRARLDAEPTVLAPQRRSKSERLHWVVLSAAASVAAVAFVGWMALPGTQPNPVQIAVLPAAEFQQVAAPAGNGANDYLLAHQRYSPSSAMQGVAPYVRTVAERRVSARR
ncbi:MAG: sigma-E factor negative regulatory protein [Burkholderiales bacterium]|nr:sigma-E factor negative regulatory protein [Burkholderiales bacterium]